MIKPPEQWSPLEPRLLRARGQASGEPLELPRRLMEADVDRFVENDLAFHATLFKAVDNVFLDALFEPLASVLRTLPSVR